MTKRILSIATAAAIAIGTLGFAAPAGAAAPGFAGKAPIQNADSLVVEVSKKGKRHKGKRWHRRHHHGNWHFGHRYGHVYHNPCYIKSKVWTPYGYVWKKVFVCQ